MLFLELIDISVLRADVLVALAVAALVQLIANLNGVYSSFRRSMQPVATPIKDESGNPQQQRIVLKYALLVVTLLTVAGDQLTLCALIVSLLTQTQIKRWSYALLALQLLLLGGVHVFHSKSVATTSFIAVLVIAAFVYCRSDRTPVIPAAGADELVFAWATGPLAMLGTFYFIVDETPATAAPSGPVVFYAYIVLLFALSFQVVQSAKDAPFARRLGVAETSLALRLGFQGCFQGFLLLIVGCYGLLLVLAFVPGHVTNLLLLGSIIHLKGLSDDFRDERLHDLPARVAKLGAFLGIGLVVSISVSAVLL